MKKLKVKGYPMIVNGTMGGHPFLNHKNHAGGAYVPMPIRANVAGAVGRKLKTNRSAMIAESMGVR